MNSIQAEQYKVLKAAGWVALDERLSATGQLLHVGRLHPPHDNKAVMSLEAAWTAFSAYPPAGAKTTTSPRPPAPEFSDPRRVYQHEIAPLLEQLDAICERAGIGGLVMFETAEDADGVDVMTTRLGAKLRTEFLSRVYEESKD